MTNERYVLPIVREEWNQLVGMSLALPLHMGMGIVPPPSHQRGFD